MTLSGRDQQRLRETLERFETTPPAHEPPRNHQLPPLPRLAKSNEVARRFTSSRFLLYRQKPDGLEVTEKEITAFTICDVNPGDICLLHRCVGEASRGYWLAVPCSSGQQRAGNTCEDCAGGILPAKQITISGLANLVGQTMFDDWHTAVNGTHALEHNVDPQTQLALSAFATGPIYGCIPTLRINVPDNRPDVPEGLDNFVLKGPFTMGVFGIGFSRGLPSNAQPLNYLVFNARPHQLFFDDVQVGNAMNSVVVYKADPATPLTLTNGKVNCEQTYSTYVHHYGEGPFKDWLAAGTYSISDA